ncbi:MAG: hypothetical protein U0Y10_16055 [Spirosomataceae bacterium]
MQSTQRTILFSFAVIFLLVIGISCTANEKKNETSTTQTDSAANVSSDTAQEEETTNAEDLTETGLLKEVEDVGYPFVVLTIEFPERKFQEFFTVNLEEVKKYDMNQLRKNVGRYFRFTYTSEIENTLIDIQKGGKTLLTDTQANITADTRKIEGFLSGADEETPGDLPGKITITSKSEKLTFEFFVTKELVAVNGKTVVGYYEERAKNVITSLTLLPK